MRKNEENSDENEASKAASKVGKSRKSPNEKRRQTIKKEGLDGHTVMTVRLRNAEFLEFSDQVEKVGLTNNRAMRIAARRIAGFLEIEDASQKMLKDIARQITGIASNVNQMAKIANTTNSVDHKNFLEERQKLGSELARVSDLQQQLLNVGRRRADGVQRLAEASIDDRE